MTKVMLVVEGTELGMRGPTECGGMRRSADSQELCCFLSAEGADAFEFFGGAIVQGLNEDGEVWKDWWLAQKSCPFRADAIEELRDEWAKVHGAITLFEVERILKLAQPEKPRDHKTIGDKMGVAK